LHKANRINKIRQGDEPAGNNLATIKSGHWAGVAIRKGQAVASLQLRNNSWRVIFRFRRLKHFITIGEVEEIEAQGVKARYEYLLRLLKQHLLTLPVGMDIVTFLRHDDKPPETTRDSTSPEVTFAEFHLPCGVDNSSAVGKRAGVNRVLEDRVQG
jgi:hypothetical protein